MMKLAKTALDLIGNTPLLELSSLGQDGDARILAKLEGWNMAGSVKDRIALAMIEDAEASGKLKPGSVIIEPTSGNTGVGLAAVARVKGYKCIIVMPDTMSKERIALMEAHGADVVLTPGSESMTGSIKVAEDLAKEHEHSFIPNQFGNPANPKVHYETTGPEIWEQSGHQVDVFVSGIGTGGTITGAGRYLLEQNPDLEIIAVEPFESPLLSTGVAGKHGIQGIGANFVPDILDRSIYNRIITVKTDDAKSAVRRMAEVEGLLVGISSGAVLHASVALGKDPAYAGKTIVTVLPDGGDRYMSMELYN